jgi:hypothetical protein
LREEERAAFGGFSFLDGVCRHTVGHALWFAAENLKPLRAQRTAAEDAENVSFTLWRFARTLPDFYMMRLAKLRGFA